MLNTFHPLEDDHWWMSMSQAAAPGETEAFQLFSLMMYGVNVAWPQGIFRGGDEGTESKV